MLWLLCWCICAGIYPKHLADMTRWLCLTPVGFPVSREVTLTNTSEVPMTFHLRIPSIQGEGKEEDSRGRSEFRIQPNIGSLPPDMQQVVKVSWATSLVICCYTVVPCGCHRWRSYLKKSRSTQHSFWLMWRKLERKYSLFQSLLSMFLSSLYQQRGVTH